MSTLKTNEEIKVAVVNELEGTQYAVSTLTPLTGGTANFIYRAKLQKALPDGATEVAIKHGEGYVAQHPDFALTMLRCVSSSPPIKRLNRRSMLIRRLPDD